MRRFQVTFEQHCEGSAPAIRGEFTLVQVAPSLPPPTPAPTATRLHFESDPGDYIGAGETVTWTTADASFAVSETAAGLQVSAKALGNLGSWWDIGMAVNGRTPAVGYYENASRFPFPSSGPTFDFEGSGKGCNTLLATYQIYDLQRAPDGTISRLQVTFEQHCEGKTAALRGELVYINP